MELNLNNNKPKKKMLSISRRERNLLLILGVAVLIWLSYAYAFTPQKESIDKLEAEKADYQAQVQKLENLLLREKAISDEWTKLQSDYTKAAEKYFPVIDQPEIMHMLNTAIDEGKLEVTAMSFKDPEAVKLEGVDANYMGMNLPFKGTYKDLESFISQLRANPRKLLLDQITLFKQEKDSISGQLGLQAYSYGNEMGAQDGYFYTNAYTASSKINPFTPFDGYVETVSGPGGVGGTTDDEGRIVVNELDGNDIYFMSTGEEVTGTVSSFAKAKYGKNSVRAEYFISTGYQAERAYITLDDKNIVFRYPPQSVGVWAYAFGYSPVTVGFRFQSMDGEKIDVELARGVNWSGWEYISAAPPQDINVYPLKLDRIYFELGPNRDDYGVMLFDRIECTYQKNEDADGEKISYVFYVVQPGDTLMSISEKFYGNKSSYKKLAKDNGLSSDGVLETGKVLVISK